MEEKEEGLDESDVWPIVKKILDALRFMHEKEIVHRDSNR